MSKIVEVPGMGNVEFPDEMPDDQIGAVLAKQAAPSPAGPSVAESLGRGVAHGAPLGFGDEITGGIQAVLRKYVQGGDAGSQQSLGDLYRQERDASRNQDEQARAANPKAFLGGEFAGGVLPAVATMGEGVATKAPSLLRALGRTALSGAKWGAVSGLGDSTADLTKDDVSGALKDTAKGAALGGALGAGMTAAGAGAGAAINGVVKLDPSNQLLRAMGVRDLTLGQAAPKSWFNSIEQASESLPILGDAIKAQRQAGRASWQNAVLNDARAPGAPWIEGTNPADVLSKTADTFDAAYQPITAHPVQPALSAPPGMFKAPNAKLPLSAALREAAADPGVRATDDVRRSVASFLDNAHSALETTAQARPLNAGDLISMRSQIRSEIRNEMAGANPDYAAARLLRNAEVAVSTSLREQLPASAARALADTDAQYAKLMRVTDAVRRGGDQPGGFTPAQLSAAVKGSTPNAVYAQGGGGSLRALASAGRQALDTTNPPTGQRLLTLGLGTAALPATAALAAGATTDIGKRLLTGGTAPQLAGQQLLRAIAARRAAVDAIQQAALAGSTEAAQ